MAKAKFKRNKAPIITIGTKYMATYGENVD